MPPDASAPYPTGDSVSNDGNTIYVKSTEKVEVPVSIIENGSGINAEKSYVKYTIDGQSEQEMPVHGAKIPVENNQTLLGYKIHLVDNVGNENEITETKHLVVDGTAPTVTITFEDEKEAQLQPVLPAATTKHTCRFPMMGKSIRS